ncbi:ABC transporter ATP-binding protein [Chakrabartyella piscis]|uniref:amino acid ABC transporter ATP-binding/permease protein n=1 Tax=Chakrabartyella piscis TaxID=2918914 RepID=UPI0029587BEA|nr:ABC transporter ATP-binding protein [Chakrabartyella piscis]
MKRSGFGVMIGLLGLVKPLAHIMFLCVTFGAIGFLCAIAITVLGGELILTTLGESYFQLGFKSICGIVLACALLRGVFRYAEQTCGHYIAFKLLAVIRDKLFAVLRKLAPAKLETRSRGDLVTLITSDIELLEVFYAHTIAPVCIAIVVSLIMSAVIGTFHVGLGIFALVAYGVIGYILPVCLWQKDNKDGLDIRNKLGNLNGFFLESLRGMEETLQYNGTEKRLDEVNEKTEEINGLQHKIKKQEGWNFGMSGFFVSALTLCMVGLNIYLKSDFQTTLLTTLMLSSSFGPVLALSNLSTTLTSTIASGERVLDLLEEQPQTSEIYEGKTPEFTGAKVENIDFSYGKEQILLDVSMELKKGQMVSLTGASGSGKSTLLKLFMRFWSAESGVVSVSGENIDEIQTKHLRDMEGYMTQDTDLFQGTLRENILLAKEDATEEEMVVAAQKASIHDFITILPDGYDTKVAELGESLSGGERQRIGLARAFLQDGDFILLDEPTANLDSLNEGMILKSLHEAKKDKTILMVSHKASTIGVADVNYHLDGGRMS